MTDDPYANPQSPTATLTPPDVSTQTPDVPPQTLDAPNPNMVSLDVPMEVDTLGDGRKTEIIGDVRRLEDVNTKQGDNPYGYLGDCGLVSCKNVFEQFGMDSTEARVVGYAAAHGLCDVGKPGDPPEQLGGTTPMDQAKILSDNGVPSHVWTATSVDDLAGFVQAGRGVIIGVNAGILWNDANYVEDGNPNHAITVIGVLRDPTTQALEGFVVNDSGTGKTTVVGADTMSQCFSQKGGVCVATDNPAPHAR